MWLWKVYQLAQSCKSNFFIYFPQNNNLAATWRRIKQFEVDKVL